MSIASFAERFIADTSPTVRNETIMASRRVAGTGRALVRLVAVCCLVIAAGAGAASAQSIVIKFPHELAPTTPKGLGADYFKKIVEERLPGRVAVEVYPSGSLMNDQTSLEALAFGEIQMIAISLSKLDRLTKRFQIFDLPFLFSDMQQVEAFQGSTIGRTLLTELQDRGILGLSYWHNGTKQLTAHSPLRVPKDAEGLKFRIMDSDVLLEEIRAIGGNPQKMAYSEVYQALQLGAIDAQENTWSNIHASKFFEVQEFITETNHGYIGYLVATNDDFWRGLPGDVRSVLDDAMAETTEHVNSIARSVNEDARSQVLASGRNTLVELSAEERAQWRAAMRPVWSMFAEDIGPELLQAAGADEAGH
jgi:C4-dicarboxylate-binding protein DctP